MYDLQKILELTQTQQLSMILSISQRTFQG